MVGLCINNPSPSRLPCCKTSLWPEKANCFCTSPAASVGRPKPLCCTVVASIARAEGEGLLSGPVSLISWPWAKASPQNISEALVNLLCELAVLSFPSCRHPSMPSSSIQGRVQSRVQAFAVPLGRLLQTHTSKALSPQTCFDSTPNGRVVQSTIIRIHFPSSCSQDSQS